MVDGSDGGWFGMGAWIVSKTVSGGIGAVTGQLGHFCRFCMQHYFVWHCHSRHFFGWLCLSHQFVD